MPFQVKKVGKSYKLWKINEKKFSKVNFKSKKTAINQAKNYMRYRNETPIVVGNKILHSKKTKK
jgi:hypothetical protein